MMFERIDRVVQRLVRKRAARSKHFLIAAAGTYGDVLPLFTLGVHLKCSGNRVTLLAPPPYKGPADAAGLEFVPFCSPSEHQQSVKDMYLLAHRYGPLFNLRYALPWNLVLYRTVLSLEKRDLVVLVVDRGTLWAHCMLSHRVHIPIIKIQIDPPLIRGMRTDVVSLPWGTVQKRLIGEIEVQWGRTMRQIGIRHGVGRLMPCMQRRANRLPTIGLYPNWFASPTPGSAARNFGFLSPIDLSAKPHAVPFRDCKERKLMVCIGGTIGTTLDWSQRFFETSVVAAGRLNCNVLLLGGGEPRFPGLPPASVVWRDFLPLAEVLPQAHAVVHHGGIGTVAAALHYGVPQLILPRFATQPSNAERLRRLGMCTVLAPKSYTAGYATKCLRELFENKRIRASAARYAGRCYDSTTPSRICALLEALPIDTEVHGP